MKINKNEMSVLRILLKDSDKRDSEIAKDLDITSQAVGKIRKQLFSKGIIKTTELTIDYEKLGVSVHAIALIKILPKAYENMIISKRINERVLKPINAIRSYSIPQTDVTHIIIYAFSNIKEYDDYFKEIQKEFGELVEIEDTYVFSSGSILKSSSKDVFLKVLEELKEYSVYS